MNQAPSTPSSDTAPPSPDLAPRDEPRAEDARDPSPDLAPRDEPRAEDARDPFPVSGRPPIRVSAQVPHTPLSVLGLLDVVVLVVATPLVLIGVPTRGYLISAGAWIALRLLGVLVDRGALAMGPSNREIGLRLAYLLGRLSALGVMVILLRQNDGRSAGLTAVLVILVAFTVELIISIVNRPRTR